MHCTHVCECASKHVRVCVSVSETMWEHVRLCVCVCEGTMMTS